MNLFQKTVAVAVSGGADSLYTLIHLQELGIPVLAMHGLFFPLTPERQAMQNRLAATCTQLGIELHIIDLVKEFEELVIRPFVQAYANGLTPNPCANCNASIKFGLLQDAAKAQGAEFLVTGHYARLVHSQAQQECYPYLKMATEIYTSEEKYPALYQASDNSRDQSYFLSLVPIDRLKASFFPLGNVLKKDILETLKQRGIEIPQPGESREVCFVPNDAYREFLPRVAGQMGISLKGAGEICLCPAKQEHDLQTKEVLLGKHKGLWQYTEGQRKGLGLAWKEPLYVLAKDYLNNKLILGTKEQQGTISCTCEQVNILLPFELWTEEVLVKIRYRQVPVKATVSVYSNNDSIAMQITFKEPEKAIAKGQIAAVYRSVDYIQEKNGEPLLQLVAGGVISETS